MNKQEAYFILFDLKQELGNRGLPDQAEAVDVALDAMVEIESAIMTFDEVMHALPRTLWCEEIGNGNHAIYPAIAWEHHRVNNTDFIMFSEHGFDGGYGAKPLYNKTWRCWTHKPSEEQMNVEKMI